MSKNGRKKKKREKFVNVTHEIMFNREEDEEYWIKYLNYTICRLLKINLTNQLLPGPLYVE